MRYMLSFHHYIIIIISYLIGSVSFSHLLVKWFGKKDVISEGSHNAGAMNSYEITGNRFVGISVFFLDLLKGFFTVFAAYNLGYSMFMSAAVAGVWVVIGHNYSIFLKFKGGRGLAAGVGVLLAINPFALILWAVMWLMGYYIIKHDVHIANAVALVTAPVLLYSAPEQMIRLMDTITVYDANNYRILVAILCIIILIRHVKPLIDYFKNTKEKS